ncbi:hypothetical protein ACTFIR_002633 [Dictyostelium discoideum]
MLINNFGVTGSNVCLILSEFKNNHHNRYGNGNHDGYHKMEIDNNLNEKKKYLIPLSSNSSTSLNNYKSSIIKHSNSNSSSTTTTSFKEFVNNQIKFKSTSLIQKSVIIASDWNEFQDENNQIKLENSDNLISNITVEKNKSPITVMVLCGQGSQYNKMALSLYENEPIFRESVNRFDKELFKYYGYSVLDKLRSIDDKDLITIHQSILAQPSNVIIQVSLYELYKHWGISADIIGHSIGEVSSSYCSGMIDFQTLCYLTYHISVAQNRTIGTGRMLSVNISSDEFINKYQFTTKYKSLEIACYNSPTSIVISEFKSNDIFCSMLGSLSSFHTSSQQKIKDEVCSLNISSKQPTVPVFSTVTTNLFNQLKILNNNNNKSIFLTGSTGFLESPKQKLSKIINRTGNISSDKLNSNIENSDNNNQISEDQLIKIIPMIGDISKDKFGLTEQDYLKLSNECDIIINSAADLDLKSNYEESKTVNVNSINQVIKLSVSNNSSQKLIVHFSSIAVFINHQLKDGEEFEETNILPNFDTTPVGYIQSKVISEKLLTNAAESRGIPSIIIRPPDIFSNPITGIGHSNDFISLFLKASKEIGYYPNIHKPIFTTPITTIAKTTIDLIFKTTINLIVKKSITKEWIELVSKSNEKSLKRYSTFHIHDNQNLLISNFKINSLFKMSNSTKEL